MEFKLHLSETAKGVKLRKHMWDFCNISNRRSKATAPKNIGQLSEIFPESKARSQQEWIDYFTSNYPDALEKSKQLAWNKSRELLNAWNSMTKDELDSFIEDLIFNKTTKGFDIQKRIAEVIAEKCGCKSESIVYGDPKNESEGIDVIINGVEISIKPNTYKNSMAAIQENINTPVVYYCEDKSNNIKIIINDTIMEQIKNANKS